MKNKSADKRPKSRRIKLAHFFPAPIVDAARGFIEGDYEKEMRLIQRRLPEGGGLYLDIGVGTGETLGLFEDNNFTGLEIDARALSIAAAKRAGRFVRGRAERLPFMDGVFSAVVMCKTGHHLDDSGMSKTAAEAWRVLEKGGIVVFLDPEPPSRKTSLAHNFIAALEVGSCHRKFEETAVFFSGFKIGDIEYFRKKQFDFYIAVFKKE